MFRAVDLSGVRGGAAVSCYEQGYIAAARWCWPRFANPWAFFAVAERCAWFYGWDDAIRDAQVGRVKPRLQAEFEVR
jgi:hypothetical protein